MAISLGDLPRQPVFAGSLGLIVAFGTSQTWARAFIFAIDGLDTDRGVVTLLAGVGIAAICVWRVLFRLREYLYIAFGLAVSLLAFFMPLWFAIDVATAPKAEFFDEEVDIITAGWALYLTIVVAAAMLASFAWRGATYGQNKTAVELEQD